MALFALRWGRLLRGNAVLASDCGAFVASHHARRQARGYKPLLLLLLLLLVLLLQAALLHKPTEK